MTSWLDALAADWWSWMAPLAWQLVWMTLVAIAADRFLLRRASPQLRCLVCALVLARLVLPATFATRWSLASLLAPSRIADAPAISTGGAVAPSASFLASHAQSWFVAWIAGALLIACAAIFRHRALLRGLERVAAPPPQDLACRAAAIAGQLDLPRVPRIVVLRRDATTTSGSTFSHLGTPAVVGFLRPLVALPEDLLAPSRARELDHVLMHELAHVRRRDPWWAAATFVVALLWWFHPAVWVLAKRMSVLRELGCDDAVARVLRGATVGYRDTLLRHARALVQVGRPQLALLPFFHSSSLLLVRLEALERRLGSSGDSAQRQSSWGRRAAALCAAAIMGIVVLPSASADRAARTGVGETFMANSTDAALATLRAKADGRPVGCLAYRYSVLHLAARAAPRSDS